MLLQNMGICFSIFFGDLYNGILSHSFSLFIANIYELNRGKISLTELNFIGSVYCSLSYMLVSAMIPLILLIGCPHRVALSISTLTVVISMISSRFVANVHQLFITFSVLGSIGVSLSQAVYGLSFANNFQSTDKDYVAVSLLLTGSSQLSVIAFPLIAFSLHYYLWRNTFLIFAIMSIFMLGLGGICVVKHDIKLSKDSETESPSDNFNYTAKSIFVMILWIVHLILFEIVHYSTLFNFSAYYHIITGANILESANITILLGFGKVVSFVGVFLVTYFFNHKLIGRIQYWTISSMGVLVFIFINIELFGTNIADLKTVVFFTGVFICIPVCFIVSCCMELTRMPVQIVFNLSTFGKGFGILTSSCVIGPIGDMLHYKYMFYTMTGFVLADIAALSLIMIINYFGQNETEMLVAQESDKSSDATRLLPTKATG